MPYFQQHIVMGNLGRDPELKYLPDQTPVLNISIVYKETWKNKDGIEQEQTTWFAATAFNHDAINISKMMKKGDCIQIQGKTRFKSYMDSNSGIQKTVSEIRISSWQAIRYGNRPQMTENDSYVGIHDLM